MKKAFTIVEFIMCIVMMFLVMSAAITIPLKKAKKTMHTQKNHDVRVCSCETPDVQAAGYECIFNIENPVGRYEFYTIQLLGGGAAGSAEKGGKGGGFKVVHYPALEGRYLVKLGEGGTAANPNGGATAIYKIKEDGNYELLEYVLGGPGSNEKIQEEELSYDPTERANQILELEKGQPPAFGSGASAETLCGRGGNKGEPGRYGEVLIKW